MTDERIPFVERLDWDKQSKRIAVGDVFTDALFVDVDARIRIDITIQTRVFLRMHHGKYAACQHDKEDCQISGNP